MKRNIYRFLWGSKKTRCNVILLLSLVCYLVLLRVLLVYELNTEQTKSQPVWHRTRLISTKQCPSSRIRLLNLVSSNVGHFDRRSDIRKSWGPDFSVLPRWRTLFLLGKNQHSAEMKRLEVEERLYGDLILSNYEEGFFSMSFKVAMGFEWAPRHCYFDFLLKSDDDTYVNTRGILSHLKHRDTVRYNLYTGNMMYGSPVLREGRYAVSKEELNKTVFTPYCSGGGYILSADAVKKIMDLYDFKRPLKIDDAYIGELANRAGINVTNNANFRMYEDKCLYRNETLVQHPATGPCLHKLFQEKIRVLSSLKK